MSAPSPGPRPSRGHAITLAAIVPASDAPPTLEVCLGALRAGVRRPEEIVAQTRPTGAGPAAARNLGVTASTAEVLVFVDSDVEVHPDALARIERHFLADPELVAVFGAY